MDQEHEVLELSGVTIEVGDHGETSTVGTLQSDVNGFRYAASGSDFSVSFLSKDIQKLCIFLEEDEEEEGEDEDPLLHLEFGFPIKLGIVETDYANFRLVPTTNKQSRHKELGMFLTKIEKKWGFQYPTEKPIYRGLEPHVPTFHGYDSDPEGHYFYNSKGILERADLSEIDG